VINKVSILAILRNPSPTQGELKKLVEICFKISTQYLRKVHKKLHRLTSSDEYHLEDIAIDATASLFIPDAHQKELVIYLTFKRWNSKINSEDDAFYFINKVVSKRTEQHISFLLKENDPIFSKILDTIKYQVKKNGCIKVHHLGMSYIVKEKVCNYEAKWISVEEFRLLPTNLFTNPNKMFDEIFNYLAVETSFVEAVPLNALVMRLKELRTNSYIYKVMDESVEDELEIESVLSSAYSLTIEKLEATYKKKGKLSDNDIEILKLTLNDMLNDLKDGGVNPGLYKYLVVHKPDLSVDAYQEKYHNILEYLLKVMRSKIAESLKEEIKKFSE